MNTCRKALGIFLSLLVVASIISYLGPQTPLRAQQSSGGVAVLTAGSQARFSLTLIGSGTNYHQITWFVVGSLSACSITLDTSTNNSTWTTGGAITAQTCTSNGSATSTAVTSNYVSINSSASITGTGTLYVTYTGYLNNPSSGSGGTITGVTPGSNITGGGNTGNVSVALTSNVAIAGPRPWIDVTNATYGADPTGTSSSTIAFNNAIAACSGGTVIVPPGTYVFGAQIVFSTPCTITTLAQLPATLRRTYSTANSTQTLGWIQISASNVAISGLIIDGGFANGGQTGNCIVATTGISNIKINDNVIQNCDGADVTFAGNTGGGASPSKIEIYHNYMSSVADASLSTGVIYARDCTHDLDIHDNPILDGTLFTATGVATIQLLSQAGASNAPCPMYNIDIHDNPKVLCAGDFSVQAGGFNSYYMYSIRVINNGFEAYQNCSGFVSIPVAVMAKIINGNHFNTHFRDMAASFADGGCTASSATFTTTGAHFQTTEPSSVGQTVDLIGCGAAGANLITTISAVTNSTTITLATNASTTTTAGSTAWQIYGYSPTFTAVEAGQNQGTLISNNVCDCETGPSSNFQGFVLDSTSGAVVSNNEILGFGEGGGIGIDLISIVGQQMAATGSITESGNVITVTMGEALLAAIQPGAYLCLMAGTATNVPPCGPPSGALTAGWRIQVNNISYSRSNGTFSFWSPLTGQACSSGCNNGAGNLEVYLTVMNNVVSNNIIFMPQVLPTSGNINAISVNEAQIADIYNNTIIGNTVVGTGASGTFGVGMPGTAESIDNTRILSNSFNNISIGIKQTIGTNTHIMYNTFNSVSTPFSYVAGTVAESTLPMAFADYVTCGSAYDGLLGMVNNNATAVAFGATVTGGGSGSTGDISMRCNGSGAKWTITGN